MAQDFKLMIVTYMPGKTGESLRYNYYKKHLNHIGKNVKFEPGVFLQNPAFISIDDNCWIDRGVIILAGADKSNRARRLIKNSSFPLERGMVHIGKHIHIAPFSIVSGIGGVHISDGCSLSSGVKIYSFSHHYKSNEFQSNREVCFSPLVDPEKQYMVEGPVFLGENVGVALHSIILPGVSIGNDSFIAINSVVNSSFAENSLIAGNPAKRVKSRFKTE